MASWKYIDFLFAFKAVTKFELSVQFEENKLETMLRNNHPEARQCFLRLLHKKKALFHLKKNLAENRNRLVLYIFSSYYNRVISV